MAFSFFVLALLFRVTNSQEAPQVNFSPSLTLLNTTFRTEYQIPENVFHDKEDGNTRKLNLYLYTKTGDVIPKNSWVSLQSPEQIIRIYVTKEIYEKQPTGGYTYRLSAIDSSGRENHTDLLIRLGGPVTPPNYLRELRITATNSVLVTSYKDVDVLFVLQSKMTTYLNISAHDIANHKFNLTRTGNERLAIEYTFSTRKLIGPNCDVNSIIDLRGKLNGKTAEEKFKEAMKPQFTIEFMSAERFEYACGHMSGSPPVIGALFTNQSIQVGRYFSFSVSQSVFTSPPNSNMRLRLQLRFKNNTNIPSNYWMGLTSQYMDENVKIHGVASQSVVNQETTHPFKLVAITPLLVESYQNIQFNLQSNITTILYKATMTQYSVVTTSYVSVASSFVSFMSTYLSISASTIIIIDYKITTTTTILSWTISTLSQIPCNKAKIDEINPKLTSGDGEVNNVLKNGLTEAVKFSPNVIAFKLSGACDIPVVNYQIPTLYIPKYDSLQYVVPIDAFKDGNDGTNVKLSLLQQNGAALESTSWIWFNSSSRVISGFPFTTTTTKQTYNFILRAIDNDDLSVDQNFTISLNWTAPQHYLAYLIQFSYKPSLLPVSNVITTFITSLKTYFKQPSSKDIIIFQTAFLSNNKIRLYYQNTSLRTDVCDVNGYFYIMGRIRKDSTQSVPNVNFVSAMQPRFGIEEVGVKLSGKCLIANRSPPNFNIADPVARNFFLTIKYVSYCEVASYLVPEKQFFDEEEGFTRNLKLNLTDIDFKQLPVDSWVNLNISSQTIFAVADDTAYKAGTAYDVFRLIATDSDNKWDNIRLKFAPIGVPPAGHYNITMYLDVMGIGHEPHVFQISPLLNSLKRLFPNGPSIHVRSYRVTTGSSTTTTAVIVWSPCNMTKDSCNSTAIKVIREVIFEAGTKTMNTNLNSLIDTRFKVTSVSESLSGPCYEEGPVVTTPIPSMNVGFCGPFSYKIPANTFTDKQDGNTEKLSLSLVKASGENLESNFWLNFDRSKQLITAVLTEEQTKQNYLKQHSFILIATDSTQLSINTTINVVINGAMTPYSHTFRMQAKVALPSNSHVLYSFATKLSSYLNDTRKNFQAITQNAAADNKWIITWSNCSLRYDPCDVTGLKQIKETLLDSFGTLQTSFQQALAPDFADLFLTEANLGPCQTNRPPTVSVPFGPIFVTSCQTYKATIPEATFTDYEQGNTRNLQLSLKNNLNSWISLDSAKQELTILATNQIATSLTSSSVTVVLAAADLSKQEARQDLVIKITKDTKQATQKINMQYRLASLPSSSNFASIYDSVRTKIIQYFSSTTVLTSVEYANLPLSLQTDKTLNAEWSSCSLPRDSCDTNSLDKMASMVVTGNTVNPALKTALQQNIEVINASFSRNGLCKDHITPPIVLNPLPILNISYCGYMAYQIPENTFYDNIDGNTRKLKLSLLNSSNQPVTEKWLDFDAQLQTLRIVPSDATLSGSAAILKYKLKAATKRGISVYDNLHMRIDKPPSNATYTIKMNFAWIGSNPPPRNVILSTVLDRFAAYFKTTAKSFHFISIQEEPSSSYPYFILQIANCTASSTRCDHGSVINIESKLYNQEGTLPAFMDAMGRSDIYVTYIQIAKLGGCDKRNTPPIVLNPPGKIQVQVCSDFNYTLPTTTFRDEEDLILKITVTKINKIPVSGSYRWVRFISSDHTLYGIVTDTVLKNQPTGGYNLTIRATDTGGLFVETFLIVHVLGDQPQNYYHFTLTLTANHIGEQFQEEREVIRIVNSYFKSSFTHLVSYTKASTSSNSISVKSSICTLAKKCDESAASFYFSKMADSAGRAVADFANAFKYRYTLASIVVHKDPLCQQNLNPPVPLVSKWIISADYCGGIQMKIPTNLFTDPEDGDASKLSLQLYMNTRTQIPSNHWFQFNKTSQTIFAWPSRDEILAYSKSNITTLVATDKTGLEGSMIIEFSFTPHPEPKYIYKLVFLPIVTYPDKQSEIRSFANVLQSYLNDKITSSVGLLKHTQSANGVHYFDYANCSVSYNPCDIAALNKVKSLLFTTTNLANTGLKDAMKQHFTVNYGFAQILPPCSESNSHPPLIKYRITELNISVCGMFTFRVPSNTFYDTEDGDTRQLSLSLLDGNNNQLSLNSWVQFDAISQTINALASVALASTQPANGYPFILIATDTSKLSASNFFNAKLQGPLQILKDCQIQIEFTADASLSSSSNNALTQIVFNGISNYFKLSFSEIGLVDFVRQSDQKFSFSWSYCSATYISTSSTTSQTAMVDYKGLVTRVMMKLFKADRRTVQTAFYSAFSKLTVQSVKTVFTGLCSNIPPIVTNNITQLSFTVSNCGYRKEVIQADLFYDYEDGYTFDLKLALLTTEFHKVGVESWINIDTVSQNLLMSLRDAQRINAQNDFMFYLQATDSKGKNAKLPIQISKLQSSTTMSPFNITFEFTLTNHIAANIYVNDSIVLSDVTARLYSLANGQSIITRQYSSQSAPADSRSFTWVACNYEQCSTSKVLQKTKQLFEQTLDVFTSFKEAFQFRAFTLQRAYYISSCDTPIMPPSPTTDKIELNITMCAPYRYKLPISTFIDSVNGEMNNMKINLLDNNKNKLSPDSWIQLNTATLEIYAIYQSSLLHTSSMTSSTTSSMTSSNEPLSKTAYFQLEATNSQGLKAYKQIKVNVLDYPYTSDCLATMKIKRNFGSSSITDLDVLYKLVNIISNFYNDKSVKIKVSKFQKTSTSAYTMTFSNCSFVFPTMKAAKWGLSESHRSSITSIFSRMINIADGSVKASFSSYLSTNGFALISIQTSYSCIESPPYSKVHNLRAYAFLCTEFDDPLAKDLFNDTRDGTNLQYSLRYKNGKVVAPNEWVQMDSAKKMIYGSVTYAVKQNIPSFSGYSYLIFATDSSGRSANISYNIKIANAAPIADVRFIFGFRSTFDEYSKTADIFINITRKIASYLDGTAQGQNILIKSYNAMHLVTFEHCKLQCQPSAMATVVQKLQKIPYKTIPSDAFKAAMGPGIIPTYTFIDGPKCIETTTVTIVVTYQITVSQSICGFITYGIPANVFSSSIGETTRDLYLTMKHASGQNLVSNSIIVFQSDLQQVQGVAVHSRLSSSMTYTITAKSPRSVSSSATTTLRINFPDYDKFNAKQSQLCSLTTSVTTTYNPDLSDVYILKKFIEKVAKYFNSDTQQIQIISYTRTNSFPIQFTISFSNCTWFSLLQSQTTIGLYYQRVSTMLSSIFTYSGTTITGFKQAFANALKPDFSLVTITTNTTTCTQPPDKPPQPKVPLTRVTAAACGEFNYQIPNDFFSDEDGGTRNLKVEFLAHDRSVIKVDSWVVYDKTTQIISGLPLNETLAKQPRDGYPYVIKATDKTGKSGYANLVIKIDGKPYANYIDKELTLFYQTTIESSFQMTKILAITRKVSTFQSINDAKNRLRIISATFFPFSRLLIKLVNCTRCSPFSMTKYADLVQNQRIQFNQHMKPEFPISFALSATGICKPGSEGIANKTQGVVHNATFCSITKLNFLQTLSINSLELGIKLAVRGVNFQRLPVDSWFWFNETSNVLEAFANEAAWNKQPANGTAFTWGVIDTANGLLISTFMEDRLRIIGSPTTSGLQYSATFDTTFPSANVDAYFISIAFNAMTSYLNRNDLQFVSLTRQQASILRIVLKFYICGLPSDCTNTGVKELDNKIFESPGKLRSQFKAIFPNGFTAISVTDNCKNQPPIIPKRLNITIPICGLYRYKIPSNFATDFEDGNADNLLISLRTESNLHLPRDSWVRFNETSKEIYAYPTESIIRTPRNSGWRFLIVIKDKSGKEAKTSLTIHLPPDAEAYYKLSFSFDTINSDITAPYLDIQIRFLSMISKFIAVSSLSQYRVLSFTKTGSNGPNSESFFLQYGICSVRKQICHKNNNELESLFQTLVSSYSNPSSQLYKYISSSFRITSLKNSTLYSIDKAPKVLSQFSIVRLNECSMFVNDIPSGTFYDEEQGTTENLVLNLYFMNGTVPASNYWMQIINNKIYIVPYGNIKSGTYYMKLSARDRCGQTANTTVTTILNSNDNKPVYEFNMLATTTTTLYPVYYIAQLKTALKTLFQDSLYKTRVTVYVRADNNLQFKFHNCTLKCDKTLIGEIKNKIFLANNIVNPELTSKLTPYYSVTSVTEFFKNCTIPQTLPPVTKRNLTVQVPVCRKMNFTVPVDTFNDPEDGGTRSLSLSLLTVSKQALSIDHWVQLDRTKQIIYGYPRISTDIQFQRVYQYLLVASDKEGNSASTPVTITITGDLPPVLYQLSLSGQTTLDNSLPNIAQEISLIHKIGRFFNDFAINDVAYSQNGNSIQFSWSFCSMRKDKCDCYKIQQIRQKMTPITIFQQHLKPEFDITSRVTEQFHGVCANTRNPELRHDRNELIVSPGQTFTYKIRYDKFYDYEDGFTRNLTLYAADSSNNALDNSAWLKIQNYKICGIMSLYKLEQMGWLTTTTTREFKTIARDRCGKETMDSYLVKLKSRVPSLGYKIIVYLSSFNGNNCTEMERFVMKISKYMKTEESSILVYNYTTSNATENSTVIIWGLRNLTELNCRNDTVRVVREKFLLADDRVNPKFVDHMKPDYQVVNVKDEKSRSCANATIAFIPPAKTSIPWWILILILILAILFLLCWLCWICIPRCCADRCGKLCGCCEKWCQPGGKYASLEEDDVAGKPVTEGGDEKTQNQEKDDDEDETMRFPPPYRIPDDPYGQKVGFENDGPEEDDGIHGDNPADDSSGYREELSFSDNEAKAESVDSGVIEAEMQQEKMKIEESVPRKIQFSPPPFSIPPLYTETKIVKRDDDYDKDNENKDDYFGDVLAEGRRGDDEEGGSAQKSWSRENEQNEDEMQKKELTKDNIYIRDIGSKSFEESQEYVNAREDIHEDEIELGARNQHKIELNASDLQVDDREKWRTNENYENNSESIMRTESVQKHESVNEYQIMPFAQEDQVMQQQEEQLKLPQPNLDFNPVTSFSTSNMSSNQLFESESEARESYNEFRRASYSTGHESHEINERMTLPVIKPLERQRVSITQPVEIKMRRSEFIALQNGSTKRRRSIPIVLENEKFADLIDSNSAMTIVDENEMGKVSFRRSLSESNLFDKQQLQMPMIRDVERKLPKPHENNQMERKDSQIQTTTRRFSRNFADDNYDTNHVEMVEHVRNGPQVTTVTRRQSSTNTKRLGFSPEYVGISRNYNESQELNRSLGRQDARENLIKRDGRWIVEKNLSLHDHDHNDYDDYSDSAFSDDEPAVKNARKINSVTSSYNIRRGSESHQIRNNKLYKYEMNSQNGMKTYLNDGYEEDSYV